MAKYTARFTDLSGYGSESRDFDLLSDARKWATRMARDIWGRGGSYQAKLLGSVSGGEDRTVLCIIPHGAITGSVSVTRNA